MYYHRPCRYPYYGYPYYGGYGYPYYGGYPYYSGYPYYGGYPLTPIYDSPSYSYPYLSSLGPAPPTPLQIAMATNYGA